MEISAKIVPALLEWYHVHARDLPWRVGPLARTRGVRPDPYRVWLSEVMLQQTTIAHGTRYFLSFTERWPSIEALAAAEDADVMAAWAGLGYYARARNLLKCARAVHAMGSFPERRDELIKLPGIGPYTAGAIAALAFGEPVAAVDGNVERVVSRLTALNQPVKHIKNQIKQTVEALVPEAQPAEFAEAMMDLGATICVPKKAQCTRCPLSKFCAAYAEGRPEAYPVKPVKTRKPQRYGHVYILKNKDSILVEHRPPKGLLGGMLGLPGSDWTTNCPPPGMGAPVDVRWQKIGEVRHVFTHFGLTLTVWLAHSEGAYNGQGTWLKLSDTGDLPSVFAKAVRLLT